MYTKDRDSALTDKKWQIKRIDELDEFYCICKLQEAMQLLLYLQVARGNAASFYQSYAAKGT